MSKEFKESQLPYLVGVALGLSANTMTPITEILEEVKSVCRAEMRVCSSILAWDQAPNVVKQQLLLYNKVIKLIQTQ